MARTSDIDEKIISLLSVRPSVPRNRIHEEIGRPASTVSKWITKLLYEGVLRETFSIDEKWKAQRTKFFIFIETVSPKHDDEVDLHRNYQTHLLDNIREDLLHNREVYGNVFFESCDIIFGSDFDILLIIYADSMDSVGTFVIRKLKSFPNVARTRTVTQWRPRPSEKPEPNTPSRKKP